MTRSDGGAVGDRRLDDRVCATLAVLEARWALRVLTVLARGPARFSKLEAAVPGVSRSMLSDRLRALEAAGLVTRTVDPGRPITTTYALAGAGAELPTVLERLREWATRAVSPHADRRD